MFPDKKDYTKNITGDTELMKDEMLNARYEIMEVASVNGLDL